MPNIASVIKGIRQTEKGARIEKINQYVLDVDINANKPQIKDAVEELFKVSVSRVTVQLQHGKKRRLTGRSGRKSDWKKAIVTVAPGQKIEMK
jgi:large subunit ribosomal protein L23